MFEVISYLYKHKIQSHEMLFLGQQIYDLKIPKFKFLQVHWLAYRIKLELVEKVEFL